MESCDNLSTNHKFRSNQTLLCSDLHLPLLDVGRLGVAAEEALEVRPHEAWSRTHQELQNNPNQR